MEDVLEVPAFDRVGEHALAQRSPVELTLRGQHGGAEQLADGVERGLPDGHDLARDHVRIDDWRTELREQRRRRPICRSRYRP